MRRRFAAVRFRGRGCGQAGSGHDGCCGAGLGFFIGVAFDDADALQIFLNDFLPHDFDVLFRLATGAFTQAVGGMFFHQHPDLLGNVGPGSEFGHSLTDEFAFAEIALSLAGQNLVGAVGERSLALRPVCAFLCDRLFSCVKLLKTLVCVVANLSGGGVYGQSGRGHEQYAYEPPLWVNVLRGPGHGYCSPLLGTPCEGEGGTVTGFCGT